MIPKPAPPIVTVVPPVPKDATAEVHYQRARELSRVGQYKDAVAEFDQALRMKPDFALAYNGRGFALYLLRDFKKAAADFDQAVRFNPKYTNAYRNRSNARRALGDTAGADADVAKANELERH